MYDDPCESHRTLHLAELGVEEEKVQRHSERLHYGHIWVRVGRVAPVSVNSQTEVVRVQPEGSGFLVEEDYQLVQGEYDEVVDDVLYAQNRIRPIEQIQSHAQSDQVDVVGLDYVR